MNIVQFKVPFPPGQSVFIQQENAQRFYSHIHTHPEIQITYIRRGFGTLFAGNQYCHFREGDIYIIGANQPHIFETGTEADKPDLCQSVSIYFNPESQLKYFFDLPEICCLKTFLSSTSCGLKIPDEHSIHVYTRIETLRNSENENRFAGFLSLLSYLSKISNLIVLDKTYNRHIAQKKYQFPICEISNYILNHYHENIELAKIAAIAHLSPQAFCRNFKKHTRKTFVTYLNEVRIFEACNMLRTIEGISISTVAYNCGFNNIISFDRVFRKFAGVSPSQFQKRNAPVEEIAE